MVDKYSGNPFDDDSDDEDGKSSKKKASKATSSSDEYAGSVKLKEGKTTNATLYYLDHTKLANNGNGLLPELRNELLGNIQTANAECEQLSASLKNITSEATRLESEPKNEELAIEVATLEKDKEDMDDSLEAARVHAASEYYLFTYPNSLQAFLTYHVVPFHFRCKTSRASEERHCNHGRHLAEAQEAVL